jgi:DNA-binding protein YbaB
LEVTVVDAGLGAAEEWIGDWAADLERRAEQASAFAEGVAGISATGSAGNGAVRVTVAASGALTDLRLDERVRQWPAARIAEQILVAMRRAQGELAGQVSVIAGRTVGAESPAGREAVESYAHRYPAQPSRPGSAQPRQEE